MATKKSKTKARPKATTKKRTVDWSGTKRSRPGGIPLHEKDIKGRLGRFETTVEHARIGGQTGAIGQTAKPTHTDKRRRPK